MTKKRKSKEATRKKSPKIRATFYIAPETVGQLQGLVARLKHQSRMKGERPLPTMSDVVDAAVRAEIRKRSK